MMKEKLKYLTHTLAKEAGYQISEIRFVRAQQSPCALLAKLINQEDSEIIALYNSGKTLHFRVAVGSPLDKWWNGLDIQRQNKILWHNDRMIKSQPL